MADLTPEERAYLVGRCLHFPLTCSCGNRCKKVVAAIRDAEHAALERAVRLVEREASMSEKLPDRHGYDYKLGLKVGMENLATAIRALKR